MKEQPDNLRIRSEEELALSGAVLSEAKAVLDLLEIDYFLAGGTLLGAYRDGDLIPWDWDLGIDLRAEDVVGKYREIVRSLRRYDFEIGKVNRDPQHFKINALKHDVRVEMVAYRQDGDFRRRRGKQLPSTFFEGSSSIPLRGEIYSTYSDVEAYLEYVYGEWQTPLRTEDKDQYLRSNFHYAPSDYSFFDKCLAGVRILSSSIWRPRR